MMIIIAATIIIIITEARIFGGCGIGHQNASKLDV